MDQIIVASMGLSDLRAPIAILALGLLGGWFVVSIIGQLDGRLLTALQRRDDFGLIPRWTFFAPRPGTVDYYLLFQLHGPSGPSPWQEEPLSSERTVTGAFWNPEKRNRKALSDVVRSLARQTSQIDRAQLWQLEFTIPYLAVLSYLSSSAAVRFPGMTQIRFMILESDGFCTVRPPRLLFLSDHHLLEQPVALTTVASNSC
jgi:hypothetical protein